MIWISLGRITADYWRIFTDICVNLLSRAFLFFTWGDPTSGDTGGNFGRSGRFKKCRNPDMKNPERIGEFFLTKIILGPKAEAAEDEAGAGPENSKPERR